MSDTKTPKKDVDALLSEVTTAAKAAKPPRAKTRETAPVDAGAKAVPAEARAPKPEKKADAGAGTKAEAKPSAETRSETKAETKAETRTESKPKPEVKAAAKPEAKSEARAEARAEAKAEPAPKRDLKIKQVRSGICAPADQKHALRALGLRRIRHEVVRPDNPSVRGQILKVRHLVEVVTA